MGDTETTNKRPNKLIEIIKNVGAAGGVVGICGGFAPIVLWGGGLAVATAITAFTIRNYKEKSELRSPGKELDAVNLESVVPRNRLKNNCCVAMIRGIEEKCINGFRLALHNPCRPLHHHTFSLSKVEIEGKEVVSTRYLISDEKIVLQVEWRHETASCSKEEIVIFDNLETRKVKSFEDHPRVLNLEESTLRMLSVNPNDFAASTDPLGTFIQTIKDNRKALEHIVNAKQAPDGGEERQEQMEETKEKETGFDEVPNEATGEEESLLIPREMETVMVDASEKSINTMRMHIWLILVVIIMLMLVASPKLLA